MVTDRREGPRDALRPLRCERRHHGDRRVGQCPGAEPAELQAHAPGPEARQLEDVADEPLHPLAVALDRLQQRPALLLGRLRRGLEQEARAGADGRERRPELVGDRGQQVGPQALQLGQRDARLAVQAGVHVPEAERRRHPSRAATAPLARPDQPEVGEVGDEPGGDTGAQVGAARGEPLLELRCGRGWRDEREGCVKQRRRTLGRCGADRRRDVGLRRGLGRHALSIDRRHGSFMNGACMEQEPLFTRRSCGSPPSFPGRDRGCRSFATPATPPGDHP